MANNREIIRIFNLKNPNKAMIEHSTKKIVKVFECWDNHHDKIFVLRFHSNKNGDCTNESHVNYWIKYFTKNFPGAEIVLLTCHPKTVSKKYPDWWNYVIDDEFDGVVHYQISRRGWFEVTK